MIKMLYVVTTCKSFVGYVFKRDEAQSLKPMLRVTKLVSLCVKKRITPFQQRQKRIK